MLLCFHRHVFDCSMSVVLLKNDVVDDDDDDDDDIYIKR